MAGGGWGGGLYSCFFVANCTCSRYTLLPQRNRDSEDNGANFGHSCDIVSAE